MATFVAGVLLKELREKQGLTMKDVSEGICSISTLSRIEKGRQNPYHLIFARLMTRLGHNPKKFYFSVTSKEEFEFITDMRKIDKLIFDREFVEAESLLLPIEENKRARNSTVNAWADSKPEETDEQSVARLELQLIWTARAIIDFNLKKNFDEVEEILLKAIKLTIPFFQEDRIENYLLSTEEATIINWLGGVYYCLGNANKAIEVLYALKENIDRHNTSDFEKANVYGSLLHNLSKYLGLEKRHKEAIELSELGLLICRKTKMFRSAPYLMTNKAYSLFYLGQKELCKELLTNAYGTLCVHGEYKVAELLKTYVSQDLNIEI